MIELIDVTQHYGVRPVLKRINLRLDRGQVSVIVGPNGMGKSTLLAVMAGVLQPQHGYAAIDGVRRQSVDDELNLRRTVVCWQLPGHGSEPEGLAADGNHRIAVAGSGRRRSR
jgi:ABC-type cobalamin/Fe3+-siderophores transport system ATPase subunit